MTEHDDKFIKMVTELVNKLLPEAIYHILELDGWTKSDIDELIKFCEGRV